MFSLVVKLEGLTGSERMLNSFIINSDAAPGELIVKLAALGGACLVTLRCSDFVTEIKINKQQRTEALPSLHTSQE